MRRTKRNILLAFGTAAVLAVAPATSVQASPGMDAESVTCQDIGGGTWCQGTASGDHWWSSKCISNYYHPTNYHSSTAIIGDDTQRGVADAGQWSKATAQAGSGHTCYTKYNPDA
ncbi:lactococcin 972 family bacteriocin [Glycomyces niveus]|uniref:Lactococcin 972 family bacteriocin n=1 Tax=Glycomyces niveus TaxID=2820287 RepID=A0ABS3TZP7_9ACTN|nr:lactococcin 972 family bacteriocin [Glycomyces sp. NEAU-S30]MBO3731997.1 lactococcin 972 family bacteriocin [Glycomyces sp. NEAU-S30]